jgi:hypothetical protein
MSLSPVGTRFAYKEAFETPPPKAKETLLPDVILEEAMLLMRADRVEAAGSQMCPGIFRGVRGG